MKNAFAPLAATIAGFCLFAHAEAPQDFRFKVEKLLDGIPQPMEIELAPDEWLLADLARHLDIGVSHLRRWMFRKGVHWRRSPLHGYYIIWADADEQERLRKLQAFFNAHPSMSTTSYPKELTTPKPRPQEKKAKTTQQD